MVINEQNEGIVIKIDKRLEELQLAMRHKWSITHNSFRKIVNENLLGYLQMNGLLKDKKTNARECQFNQYS
ncbi:hypothetical protein [Clostridium estertheticum]|uniref:Uncharacterized protein n=2 Tax=Clostridium estertheticum TaxID=238834 RepID=A0A7Y3SVY3_9CLOT|nr:hypothetical protein [Clostridium estertheticum]NNU76346.1 hypothetical protein [Clostridium estertheticum]